MGKKRDTVQFRYSSLTMEKLVPFVSSTSAEGFKHSIPYNLFYKFPSEHLGILHKQGIDITGHFYTRVGTSDIGLNRLGIIGNKLGDGDYIIDAKREKIIYDFNVKQPNDEADFYYSPYSSGDNAKLLILREDRQKAIFAYRQSTVVTMCYFTTAIAKFMKPSNDVNTLRGITLLVEFLHRQNPRLKEASTDDIKNFLHLLSPQTKNWGLTIEQTNKVTDIIISTMAREPVIEKEEESLNDKVNGIVLGKSKEPLETVQLTDFIEGGFNGTFDTNTQVEIIIDIKLEGHLSAILEMYTEHGIVWVYTHDKENVTEERVQDALALPVELDNIMVVDYMDIN